MHDIFKCEHCLNNFEKAFAAQPEADQLATLKVFVAAVADGLEGKTDAEIAASPDLSRDAEWLKRARAAIARHERSP